MALKTSGPDLNPDVDNAVLEHNPELPSHFWWLITSEFFYLTLNAVFICWIVFTVRAARY